MLLSATMAISTTKLFVLGFLCATAIVLGSGIVTLTVVLHKRKEIIQARRLAKKNKARTDDNNDASSSSPSSQQTDGTTAQAKLAETLIPKSKTIKPHPLPPPPSHAHFLTHGPNPITATRDIGDIYHTSPSTGNHTPSITNLRNTLAPASNDVRTAADAHLAAALREIPFEATGGYSGSGYPTGGQVGGISGILYGSYGHQDRRGQDFVKLDHEGRWDEKRKRGSGTISGGTNKHYGKPVFLHEIILRNFVTGLERLGMEVGWMRDLLPSVLGRGGIGSGGDSSNKKDSTSSAAAADKAAKSTSGSSRSSSAVRALHHLVKASELGNPLAQTMVAQSLANGILPVSVPSGGGSTTQKVAGNLTVPTDFAHGGSQLSRAIVLWHSAAMGGSVEAALALGYRAKYSAGLGNHNEKDKFVLDGTLRRAATADKIAEYKRAGMSEEEAARRAHREEADTNPQAAKKPKLITGPDGRKIISHENAPIDDPMSSGASKKSLKDETTPATHPSSQTSHYGLLGTCESALAYYETAAHLAMDEMEASELRGKVTPATDNHRLPIIHAHGGASSALSHANKPDELEEAIQYYRLRAYAKPEPDINAAYTLAQLYHHGLRGVKQSLSLALEYYTIAAEAGSWEAAGQAGKFHLWGMGVNKTERDLGLAYRYFKMGSPGGVEGCLKRYRGKTNNRNARQAAARRKKNKKKKEAAAAAAAQKKKEGGGGDDGNADADEAKEDDAWVDETEEEYWDDLEQCDHPCVNGMGLLYLFGVPMVLPPSREVATKYFNLARDMGNMDASYNLAMMRLGWMEEVGARDSIPRVKDMGMINNAKMGMFVVSDKTRDNHGLTSSDYRFALQEFNRASGRGHIQAKHRLGMLLSKGVTIIDPDLAEIAGPDKMWKAMDDPIPKNCPTALSFFKTVAENSLAMTRRVRAAYKQYVAGDYASSLRNYLAAAESGNVVAQINAAFLLERGTCLGLSPADCTNAAVRMWRAAARQGDVEACLRVGDFYYYGRLLGAESEEAGRRKSRGEWDSSADGPIDDVSAADGTKSSSSRLPGAEYKIGYSIGPYPWIRYVLYPEDLVVLLRKKAVAGVRWILNKKSKRSSGTSSKTKPSERTDEQTCPSGLQSDGTCSATGTSSSIPITDSEQDQDQDHMALAARYYRMAAEEHDSARANFNLGFMHEWGLGLKQDFPLAKRHYDLAASSRSGEAELAVQFAFIAMDWHERLVKWKIVWDEWREALIRKIEGELASDEQLREKFVDLTRDGSKMDIVQHMILNVAVLADRLFGLAPTSALPKKDLTESSSPVPRNPEDVLMDHLLSWETLVILLLAVAIARLITDRVERQQRARA